MHSKGLQFALFSATFAADDVGRRVPRCGVEPTRDRRVPRHRLGFHRERREDLLRDILGEMHISAQASQCRRVNSVEMPAHNLRKRVLGAVGRVAAKEGDVVLHVFSMATAGWETEHGIFRIRNVVRRNLCLRPLLPGGPGSVNGEVAAGDRRADIGEGPKN